MGWKNWSYWLKGAVIGLIIFVIYLIIFYSGASISAVIFLPALAILYFITGNSSLFFDHRPNSGITTQLGVYADHFVVLIVFCIVGAIIGWIYGMIKRRK